MFREVLQTAMALVLLATFAGGLAIVAAQLAAKDVDSAARRSSGAAPSEA